MAAITALLIPVNGDFAALNVLNFSCGKGYYSKN
jgi:hypothetical protein